MCRVSSDSLQRISLQGLRTYGVLFFFAGSVFHTFCFSFAASSVPLSLSVVDQEIGLRLDALKHDYFEVLRS